MRFSKRLLGKLWNLGIAICKAVKGFVRKIVAIFFFDRALPLLPLQNPAAATTSTITEPLLRHTPALISSPTTFDDDRYSVCEDRLLWCQAEIDLYRNMKDHHVAALDMATVFVDEGETPYLKKKKQQEEEEKKKGKEEEDKEEEKREVEETLIREKRKNKKLKEREKVKVDEKQEETRETKKQEEEVEETSTKAKRKKKKLKEKEKVKENEEEEEEETMEKEKKMRRRQKKKEEKRKENEKEKQREEEDKKKKEKNVIVLVKERWIKHYSSRHRILLVGEGNFSFSACLAKAFRCAPNVTATSLDSEAFLKENYRKALSNIEELRSRGSKVLHKINATTMANHHLLRLLKFDRIVFNFPYAGLQTVKNLPRRTQIDHHQRLVSGFIENAREMISEEGEIHITHKTNGFHEEWWVISLACGLGLRLIEAVDFELHGYPGYNTMCGFGGNSYFNCYPSQTYKFGLPSQS